MRETGDNGLLDAIAMVRGFRTTKNGDAPPAFGMLLFGHRCGLERGSNDGFDDGWAVEQAKAHADTSDRCEQRAARPASDQTG
jgi:hypothetical protein